MYLIIYRPHNKLHCETQYIGPFLDYMAAEDALCSMPALGPYQDDGILNLPGVKWLQELRPALNQAYDERRTGEWLQLALSAHELTRR